MKVIIAGSRTINPSSADIARALARFDLQPTEIVSGHARGVDAAGERYARTNGIPVRIFHAAWDDLGRFAGPARNRQMAEYADAAVVFWDGTSRGTKSMRDIMQGLGKPCLVVSVEEVAS